MFLSNLISNPYIFLGFIIALIVAISIHESAHAWVAHKLGDDTAKLEGRISLNPLHHLDPLGTIFLLLVGFGWGKPVPVNHHNLKNPKLDNLKISLAGPISNFIAAIIFAVFFRLFATNEIFGTIIYMIIQLNLVLMIFNLIPIPPLDGSGILTGLLPDEVNQTIHQLSFPLLMVFLLFAFSTNYISDFIQAITSFFLRILVGIS